MPLHHVLVPGSVDEPTAGSGIFNARIAVTSGTIITLAPFGGARIEIAGDILRLAAAGITCDLTANNTIDATGADSGALPAASTLYHIYVAGPGLSNGLAGTLRLCLTAPAAVVLGVPYLNNVGDAAFWRHAGWCRPDAVPNFKSSIIDRLVVNRYNRQLQHLLLRPGYVSNNADNTLSLTAAAWAPINGGVGDVASYIANGQDSVIVTLSGTLCLAGAGICGMGVGDNTIVGPMSAVRWPALAAVAPGSMCYFSRGAEGEYRQLNILGFTSGVAATWFTDYIRNGAASDPAGLTLAAGVMV